MEPNATLPDIEVDEFSGELKRVQLRQNSFIQTGINRNLLYVKPEIDAKFNALANITVSNTAPANPKVNDLWVDTT